jgi:sensor histidine kinase regulating citrate/malate metabolism
VEKLTEDKAGSASAGGGFFSRLSTHVANALRYWEPRRLIYNAVLGVVVVGQFLLAWPLSREKMSLDLMLGLFVLAVLANIAYCAVCRRSLRTVLWS